MPESNLLSGPATSRVRVADRSVLLSPAELAGLLGVPVATIYRWRSQHDGPPGFRVGRHVRYRLDDVQEWLDTRRDQCMAEHRPRIGSPIE